MTCLDGLEVTNIAFLTVEGAVAIGTTPARFGYLTEGCFRLQGLPIRASVTFATPAPDLLARMMHVVVRLETFVTVVAEVCTLQKARERITTMVMIVDVHQHDLLVILRSLEGDHVRFVHRHYFDLIVWEHFLKLP